MTLQEPTERVRMPDHDDLELLVRPERDRIVVVVSGEIDMASAPTLGACLAHIAADTFDSIVLDLSGVTFLDSTGITTLLWAHRLFDGSPRRLSLRDPSSVVRRLLHMTGVADVFAW